MFITRCHVNIDVKQIHSFLKDSFKFAIGINNNHKMLSFDYIMLSNDNIADDTKDLHTQ